MLRATIGTKLSICTFLIVGGLFGAFIAVTSTISAHQAEQDAFSKVIDESALLNSSVDVLDHALRNQVDAYANIFKSRFQEPFGVDGAQPVEVEGIATPALRSGALQLNLNFAAVDAFTALTGAYATIFVRQGDEFVRITTSHKKENGERAIGTRLDHASPSYARMLQGESYAGAAHLFGGQYMTRYDPIKDASGAVIGIVYVGINFTQSLQELGQGIKARTIGKEGGFYLLSARAGKDLGRALIHRKREGQLLLDEQDQLGQPFVRTMLAQKNGTLRYTEAGKNGAAGRERIAAFRTLPNWQMLIVGDAYLDEVVAVAVAQRNQYAVFGLLMVALVTALLYAMIRKMVAKPIGKALSVVETVATGNLAVEVSARSGDESGRLMVAMQEMIQRLSAVVTEVRQGTNAIVQVSSQVEAGNMELSARTEQQASALEETAASMEQMNAAVQQNAEHARNAQQLARAATDTAMSGSKVVAQVMDKMGAMNEASRRIGDIISVIDGIAFQTNILALNAAVEAARAGEQGRGFAVVAQEVRTLAQRSSGAAKEIKQLITESIEHVSGGVVLAERAGNSMSQVMQAITKVNGSIDEISAATQEQAAGIEQINAAVAQLDQVTQQNAALVEEAAAAAQHMSGRTARLVEVVEFFELDKAPAIALRLPKSDRLLGSRRAPVMHGERAVA